MHVSDHPIEDPTLAVGLETGEPNRTLERGALVGRYVVLAPLGHGGMGVVYKAYDPELERAVALKLLHASGARGDALRPRLLREAQALAQLAHPHVVAVHDVGTVGEDVFVAMEYIEGATLRAWLKAAPRSSKAILEVFRAAGEGLAAAHRAGIVHRDFKPDNVIVGDDGRVRVLDFGLAFATEMAVASKRNGPASKSEGMTGTFTGTITGAGAVLGTPRYMAPEQHAGVAVDERADQFGFCVSLFEALHGVPPFEGRNSAALRKAIEAGRIAPAPAGVAVPRWLRKILLRGLAADPAVRFPSMAALLEALAADPRARARRWAGLAGVLAAGAVMAAALLAWRSRHDERKLACAGAERKLEGAWDGARKAAVRGTFTSSPTPFAAAVLPALERVLDGYAQAWTRMHRDACEATRLRGDQSEEVLNLRMTCLDDRRLQLQAMTALFAQGGDKVVERAVQAAQALPPIEQCADLAALRAPVPPPRDLETTRKVDDLRNVLARAYALQMAGSYAEASDLAEQAVGTSQGIAYRPIRAEANLRLGQILRARGFMPRASQVFYDAYVEAIAGKHDDIAARATVDLVMTTAQQSHYEESERWATLSEASVTRLSTPDVLRGQLAAQRSRLRNLQSHYDEALVDAKLALELLERACGPDDLRVATAHDYLGQVYYELGRYAESLQSYDRGRTITERVLGPDHPTTAVHWINAANVRGDMGEHQRAIADYERGLAIMLRVSPNHSDIVAIYNNLGEELIATGRLAEAKASLEKSYEAAKASLGPSRSMTTTLVNLARANIHLGNFEAARGYAAQALAMAETLLGPNHRRTGDALEGMGEAMLRLGKLDDALSYYKRALDIEEKTLGMDHVGLTDALKGLGRVQLARKAPDLARPFFERALRLRASQPSDGQDLAVIRFGLAQALAAQGEKGRARALALEAREGFRNVGAAGVTDVQAVDAWLARSH